MSGQNLVIIDTPLEYKDMDTHSKRNCTGLYGLNFFHEEIIWDAINEASTEKPWHENVAAKNEDEMNEKFHENITQVCQEHIRKKKSGKRRKKVPEDRKRLMRIRSRTLKKSSNFHIKK